MSEFLTVRLTSQPGEPILWAVWSSGNQEVIASGELQNSGELASLAEYAAQRQTLVLLPGDLVILKQVAIPSGAARQFDSMLPFLLEDDIAQDVDELHFHVLAKRGDQAFISAVDRSYLKSVLDDFSQAGISVRRVMPDCLALPLAESGVSAAQIGSQWLLRKEQNLGFVLSAEWLALLDEKALATGQAGSDDGQDEEDQTAEPQPAETTVTCFTPLPSQAESLAGEWRSGEPELVTALLSKGALDSKVNLLSGEFKPASSWLKHWKVWRKVGVAAALLVAVMGAKTWLEVSNYEQQAAQYRAESERIFRTIFPQKRKIPTVSYLKRQMETEERRLSGGGGDDGLLIWLADLPQALKAVPQMQVQSVKYDSSRGEIRIQVSSDDFQSFEVVRVALSEQFDVQQGQLNRNGERVFGSYVIRRKS